MTFDPNEYKTTTRQQWEEYADGWAAWAPLLERWLGDATQTMLDMADLTSGSRVLDVRCAMPFGRRRRVGAGRCWCVARPEWARLSC